MEKKYILVLIPFLLYIAFQGIMPLMEPDEARYSLIPREMNQTGNYITPHIKNTVYLEKPPLAYWATAISFKIFGENDFSARLFVGLCAWGCILLAYWIGRDLRDEKTGIYAAMLLTVSLFPFMLGHLNILDTPLTFFVCSASWVGYLALQYQKKILYYLFYFFCALGFLTKGMIGIVFPFGILTIWLIGIGRWRAILKLLSPVGIIIFLIVVCPWLILAQKENADFLWFFFVREHFLRFTTPMHGKTEPFYFYWPILIGGLTPWLFFLIKAWKNKYIHKSLFGQNENKLLVIWFLLILIFYQISSSKLVSYVAPLFLPLVLFAACIFRDYEEEMPQLNRFRMIVYKTAIVLQSVIGMMLLLLPPFLNQYSDAEKGLIVMVSDQWWLYIIIPMISLILLIFLPDVVQKKFHRGWFLTLYILCAVFLGGILWPMNDFLSPYRSAKVTKEAIARYLPKNELLYQYCMNFYGIDFYNKIRTPIVADVGELFDGAIKLPEKERRKYFLTIGDFIRLCEQRNDVYCITQHKMKLQQITERFPRTEILWENKAFYLLRIKNRG